jgi:hypothetical protein
MFFFGYSKDKQDEFIEFAEPQSGTHTEVIPEDIEEAELGEAWDQNAAEDAPTKCLAHLYYEEENDDFEKTILIDRKLE